MKRIQHPLFAIILLPPLVSCSEYLFFRYDPRITVFPSSIDFGDVILGEEVEFFATISNIGGRELVIDEVSLSDNRGFLSIREYPGVLETGHSGYMVAVYLPLAEGVDYGTISIFSNDPDSPVLHVPVQGEGFAAVSNTPPKCSILSPLEGDLFNEDEYVPFSLYFDDGEDPPEALYFQVISSIDDILAFGSPGEEGGLEFDALLSGGEHLITLTASDSGGLSCLSSVRVTINFLPECLILSPPSGSLHFSTSTIHFEGSVSDVEDPPSTLSISWESDLDGLLDTSPPSAAGEVSFYTPLSAGTHTISLYSVDSTGGMGSDTIPLTVVDCGVWDRSTSGWVKYPCNPVLDATPSSWNSEGVWNPSVVFHEGTFYMAFHGSDASSMRVGMATSTEGTGWTEYSGNPVLSEGAEGEWDEGYAAFPSILHNGSSFLLWYAGYSSNLRVGIASSENGFSWEKYPGNPILYEGEEGEWDNPLVGGPSAFLSEEGYLLYYQGSDGAGMNIGLALSSDPYSPERYPINPVLSAGESGEWDSAQVYQPSVLFEGDRYHLFYEGSDGTERSIGYGYSLDGREWTKFEGNPVIEHGGPLSFDQVYAATPSVLFDDPYFKMWYGGFDGTSYRIGYAVNMKPDLELLEPSDGEGFPAGEEVVFSGTVDDMGHLEGIQISVETDAGGIIGEGNPDPSGYFEIAAALFMEGVQEVLVTAMDEGGISSSTTLSLSVY